jgi:SAM-dependent methyltransferase
LNTGGRGSPQFSLDLWLQEYKSPHLITTEVRKAPAVNLTADSVKGVLNPYFRPDVKVDWTNSQLPACAIQKLTPGLAANARYFSHPEWAGSYFKYCHRSPAFRGRWRAATGSWDDKIVVDIGCGPGNIFATVGGKPKLLIGVDVAEGGLKMAREIGYTPLLADAHDLPFISGFADVVVLNAALHHCDDMRKVLAEAGRLVAPGGVLVSDHDPQSTAWNFRGPAKWAWDLRLTLYLWIKKGFHRSVEEQTVALQSEIHHEPGRGVDRSLYEEVLQPLGFDVRVFPHNHDLGSEALEGAIGRAARKYRLAQFFSGMNPNSPEAALSLLCQARRVSAVPLVLSN